MSASHPSPICTAVVLTGLPIRIRIAAGVSSPLARRDRRGVLTFRSAGLAQFRSAALGGASLIAGLARVGARICVTVGARVQRVFAVIQKGSGVGSLHVHKVTSETERDAPQFRARGA